jgi:hypothetical protein
VGNTAIYERKQKCPTNEDHAFFYHYHFLACRRPLNRRDTLMEQHRIELIETFGAPAPAYE